MKKRKAVRTKATNGTVDGMPAEQQKSKTLKGTVLSVRRGVYRVESEDGGTVICRAASNPRKKSGRIIAGDRVEFAESGYGNGFITSLSERRNCFIRPPAANVDQLVIVLSPKEPEPYFYNVDLLTVIARKCGAEAAIIVTKADLGGAGAIREIYRKAAIPVVVTSSKGNEGTDEAKKLLEGRISVICGASGVGKSSLLNAVYPGVIEAETGTLSDRIKRGKNTTRVTELFPLGNGTYAADTPGFSAVDTELYCSIDYHDLYKYFPEFEAFTGDCRYGDCTHTKESECGIAQAVEKGLIAQTRYESYKKLYYELKKINRYK
ncbi:MAG: ribosome small subunit-dependent GTPase A [Clostridia bacterium]|nr:ribosome small subunit-dependent GTPase A [Clostridia bacterium]